MKVESRKVSDSRVETVHIVRPNHLNAAGRLFGGMLMQWIDEVAALVAKRHTHTNVTTASVDNLSFLKASDKKMCNHHSTFLNITVLRYSHQM